MFIWYIIIGLIAGWAAGKIMRGGGFGFFINLIVGVLGGWLFSLVGLQSTGGIIGSLIVSTFGAIVLLWFVALMNPPSRRK